MGFLNIASVRWRISEVRGGHCQWTPAGRLPADYPANTQWPALWLSLDSRNDGDEPHQISGRLSSAVKQDRHWLRASIWYL